MDLRMNARELRKNLTTPERMLWSQLRGRKLKAKFRRQAVIGTYIVDFISFDARLVIEVDGRQHLANEADVIRDAWLMSRGYKVLRFPNDDVRFRMEAVVAVIESEIAKRCDLALRLPPQRLPSLVPLGRGTLAGFVDDCLIP